jgi:uncharacterized membrane protein YfcA
MEWILGYLFAGALVGFFAGLLGIGGGMTLVPILSAMFAAQALTDSHTVHMALATAMASAAFTSSASVREHARNDAVDWAIVKRFVPGMVVGSLAATLAAGWLPQRTLAIAFAVIVYAAAVQMLLGKKPTASRPIPGAIGATLIGTSIGTLSGLVSAGGTFLLMPVLLFCGVTMHRAIGTGAAIGIPVTAVGTIGYVIGGWQRTDLPDPHLGFVYLPALIALVVGSWITAPIGARSAHQLPVITLKRVFALLLFVLATKMVVTYA